MNWWKRNKAQFEEIKQTYGKIALGTYLVLWAMVLVGFGLSIHLGYTIDGIDSTGGILFGSWVAAKVTQPARIAATVVLTPIIAKLLRKQPQEQPIVEDA